MVALTVGFNKSMKRDIYEPEKNTDAEDSRSENRRQIDEII